MMNNLAYISIAVVTALTIGAITVTATDHVQQSNMAVKQTGIIQTQERYGTQIDENIKAISSNTASTDMINWKLEVIFQKQKELHQEYKDVAKKKQRWCRQR
jgi:hypothetical protein